MSLTPYLPSAKFAVMAGAILLSGGLVIAAQSITHPDTAVSELTPDEQAVQAAQAAQWQQVLADTQAQSGVTAPQAADADAVGSLITGAQSSNLTTEVGRTLFIKLSAANSQGLGQDMPTQDQLIEQAAAQVSLNTTPKVYTTADLMPVPQTSQSLHAYGNGLIAAVLAHPGANTDITFAVIGLATDNQDASKLTSLSKVSAAYRALVTDLLALPVPQTLVPLHLQLINGLSAMVATYPDMGQVLADPLRGLAALKTFQTLADEVARVYTNLGQTILKDGILFSKDEPGAAWSVLLTSQ